MINLFVSGTYSTHTCPLLLMVQCLYLLWDCVYVNYPLGYFNVNSGDQYVIHYNFLNTKCCITRKECRAWAII